MSKFEDTVKEMEAQIDELEKELAEKQIELKKVRIGDVVDDAKDIAEKGVEFIGGAAKGAMDFADVQLKQAKNVFERLGKEFDETRSRRRFEKYRPIFPETVESG